MSTAVTKIQYLLVIFQREKLNCGTLITSGVTPMAVKGLDPVIPVDGHFGPLWWLGAADEHGRS